MLKIVQPVKMVPAIQQNFDIYIYIYKKHFRITIDGRPFYATNQQQEGKSLGDEVAVGVQINSLVTMSKFRTSDEKCPLTLYSLLSTCVDEVSNILLNLFKFNN